MRVRRAAAAAAGALLAAGAASAVATRAAPGRGAPAPNVTSLGARGAAPRRARAAYGAALDSLGAAVAALGAAGGGDAPGAARAFRRARLAYKRAEALAEYYAPHTARAANGPALERAEEDAPDVAIAPTGFQVVEAALFPTPRDGWRAVVDAQARLLARDVALLRRAADETTPTGEHVFGALRLEVARVATLGIAGFDAPLSGDGVRESAAALRGVRATLDAYAAGLAVRPPAFAEAAAALGRAADYLDAHPDFERLDRLAFLVGYAGPAARAVDRARQAAGVSLADGGRAWVPAAASPYDAGAFAPAAFAPPDAPPPTPALVALGRSLFFEPALSGGGRRSCASCHQPGRAFTDGRARRLGLGAGHGADASGRNTPTVLNVGLQPGSFYDQRTTYLEDQVTDVIGNRAEMRHGVDAAAARLARRPAYRAAFAAAFAGGSLAGGSLAGGSLAGGSLAGGSLAGGSLAGAVSNDAAFDGGAPDGGARPAAPVTAGRLRTALAAYLRSLRTLDAPFDRAVHGDTAALAPAARRGFTVFMGKARCGTCHFAPLFNGVTPPGYTEAEPEVIGVPARAGGARVDPDAGRFAVDHIPSHRHAFKTPTLRNVARTAPYMHNGAYRTLEEVVDFYDGGGGAGLGIALPNQTLAPDSLRLTRGEKRDLVAFLGALTDSRTQPTTPR